MIPIEPVVVEQKQEIEPEEVDEEEEELTYFGNCTITHYCNCYECAGEWAYGPTASGSMPCAGWTVACGDLPLGTKIMINGHEYMVEDRGVNGAWIDIYCDSHDEALSRGQYSADVYIVN